MRVHICFIDYKLWKIKGHGDLMPRDPMTNELNNELDYIDENEKLLSQSVKTINILFCALDPIEFNRVSTSKLAKEI